MYIKDNTIHGNKDNYIKTFEKKIYFCFMVIGNVYNAKLH